MTNTSIQGCFRGVYKGQERTEKVYCSYLGVLCQIKESINSIIVTIDICKISKQDKCDITKYAINSQRKKKQP